MRNLLTREAGTKTNKKNKVAYQLMKITKQ